MLGQRLAMSFSMLKEAYCANCMSSMSSFSDALDERRDMRQNNR